MVRIVSDMIFESGWGSTPGLQIKLERIETLGAKEAGLYPWIFSGGHGEKRRGVERSGQRKTGV